MIRVYLWPIVESLYKDNVLGTINVLEAAKNSKSVRRFIYVGSTTAIFGGTDMLNVIESNPHPLLCSSLFVPLFLI